MTEKTKPTKPETLDSDQLDAVAGGVIAIRTAHPPDTKVGVGPPDNKIASPVLR